MHNGKRKAERLSSRGGRRAKAMTGRIGRIVAMQGAEHVHGLNRRSLHTHRNDRRENPAIHFKVGKIKD